jgi:hypothetical protein
MNYLLKTEPSAYSFDNLLRDKTTIWDGVTNPAAVKNLRAMQPGDRLVIYHTGDDKLAVGTAEVVRWILWTRRRPWLKSGVKAIRAPKSLTDIMRDFRRFSLGTAGRLSVVRSTPSSTTT